MIYCDNFGIINIVNKIFTKDLTNVESHTIHYGYILDNNKKIDGDISITIDMNQVQLFNFIKLYLIFL